MSLESAMARAMLAVSKKPLLPIMTAAHHKDGRLYTGDGVISIDTECDNLAPDIDFTVPAVLLRHALERCEWAPDKVQLTASRLVLARGAFKARLPLVEGEYPVPVPAEGKTTRKGIGALVDGFGTAVMEFVGNDASRLWGTGLLLRKGWLYATNNISAARVPVQAALGPVAIPREAAEAVMALGAPTGGRVGTHSITFQYQWGEFTSRQYDIDSWPNIEAIFANYSKPDGVLPTDELQLAVESLLPFCHPDNPVVVMEGNTIRTAGDHEESTRIKLGFDVPRAAFRAETLLRALRAGEWIDLSTYPDPCSFGHSNGLQGLVMGVRE